MTATAPVPAVWLPLPVTTTVTASPAPKAVLVSVALYGQRDGHVGGHVHLVTKSRAFEHELDPVEKFSLEKTPREDSTYGKVFSRAFPQT